MSTAPSNLITPSEYLAHERGAESKSEYYRGRIWAMAGANERHNLITGNIYATVRPQVRTQLCKAYVSDMKVRVARTGLYTYPDVIVACGDVQFEGEANEVLLNPCVLVEVLSKSTETRDRGWKFQNYWNIPSLVDYLLVSQEQPLVEQFVRKTDDIWTFRRYMGLEAVIELAAIPCRVPLRDVYADVVFGPEDGDWESTVSPPPFNSA